MLLLVGQGQVAWSQWAEAPAPIFRFAPPNSPARPFAAARYRGTVGRHQVTVELDLGKDENGDPALRGTVRFAGQPAVLHYLRAWPEFRPTAALRLVEADSAQPTFDVGFWRANQPAGPRLTGTWTGPTGLPLPFELREDYHDDQGKLAAVPYEMLMVDYVAVGEEAMRSADWRQRVSQDTVLRHATMYGMYGQDYLHLLGPDTLRPALADLQCPPPAARAAEPRQRAIEKLNRVAEARQRGGYEEPRGTEEEYNNLFVEYLDHGLLSWAEDHSYCSGTSACSHGFTHVVYDLNTGAALMLTDILQPGAAVALRHALARHLRTDDDQSDFDGPAGPGGEQRADDAFEGLALPANDDFGLVEKGLVFHYSDRELLSYRYGPELVVPWAELLPLLRPNSPMARMLRERGLWRSTSQ
ncbi:RsiV family protein [Hymenobacter sp. 5317J-9]|uniref:RsiV family protein n=1 Tax=Hymenobacter sp. 5317J-9 TaxID=2932250 RepID=UPI001FD66477|nr:RsiV family protein [Hymenobacter sp. 5317J-9]UOQ98541.1 RsiV family protein [Hymenobacter sp. 5317J-9]